MIIDLKKKFETERLISNVGDKDSNFAFIEQLKCLRNKMRDIKAKMSADAKDESKTGTKWIMSHIFWSFEKLKEIE